jgi:hypothetical protein
MTATIADGVVFTVEIGFSTSLGLGKVPLNSTLASINWTDVSAYVRGVTTNRGRSSELDSFQTGSASIVFSNADRRFDPEYTAGPYYGALTPLRPVRIRAQYGAGATTNLFFGWIDGWPQTYEMTFDSTVTVNASDAFKLLNLITLDSYYAYYAQTLMAVAGSWFRMDDGDDSPVATAAFSAGLNQGSGQYVDATGVPTTSVSAAGLVANDTNLAAVFDGNLSVAVPESGAYPAFAIAANQTSVWFSTSTTTDGTYGIFDDGYGTTICMVVSAGLGTIECMASRNDSIPPSTSTTTTVWTSPIKVNDGKPHHVAISWDQAVDGYCRLDNISAIRFGVGTYNQRGGYAIRSIGKAIRPGFTILNFIGTIDEVLTWGGFLTTTAASNLYAMGKGTFGLGNITSNLVIQVLNMIGWMTDARSITTGTGRTSALNVQGSNALAALQSWETAEQGKLFIDASGNVKFIGRNTLWTQSIYAVSQRTYGDGTGELPYTGFESSYDDQLIYNVVSGNRVNGPVITTQDTNSQGQYFIRPNDLSDLNVTNNQQVLDIVSDRLYRYAQPKYRIESITINPKANPASLYPAVIGDEIGTRVTVKRRPQNVGSVISQELSIEGIQHSITPDSWQTNYLLAPAIGIYFTLDSATFGVLDSNVLGY